jgi:hypothetical protein
MRSQLRRSSTRSVLARLAALALVAGLAAGVLVGPVRGAGESAARSAAAAWNDVFGARPEAASRERMIVVLSAPSLADRIAQARTAPSAGEQKRWVAEAEAAQRVLLARLEQRGLVVRPVHSFTRTMNGFSAVLDARAQADLARMDGVAGVYPVRTLYPAAITSEALEGPPFRPGVGRRAESGIPGFDGGGIRIALLDSGVALDHPALGGRVEKGIDLVDRDRRAEAEPKPDEPTRTETHGTRMAGIVVANGGPAGLSGIAPGARIFPIRILGWEQASDGTYAQLGFGDALIAGLERAVDPDGDGDVEDATRVALAAVVEPYASFPDSPETRAVAGATKLGTLVVAPAGNDGRAGRGFGTVGAPGGAADALTVGAADSRTEAIEADARLVVDGDEALAEPVAALGAVAPGGEFSVAVASGPTLAAPKRSAGEVADGSVLADFFDTKGVSRVAGRAAILPTGPNLQLRIANAVAAGAGAVIVAGGDIRPGALDLDETTAVPIVSLPTDAAEQASDAVAEGRPVTISFAGARLVPNADAGRVAAFSSGGLAFDGHVKPELVAPGVGIATTDAGSTAEGGPRYATATGSSAAAAVVAASAAALAQARPGLSVGELKSLLVGSARQLLADGTPVPVTVQGAGMVDPSAAAAAELAVEPVTIAYGRAGGDGWQVSQTVRLRNLSTRQLSVSFGVSRDAWGAPDLRFAAAPATVTLRAGASAEVMLSAAGDGPLEGDAGGTFVAEPEDSRAVRIPWAVSFRGEKAAPLLTEVELSEDEFSGSDAAPAVLSFRAGGVETGDEGQDLEPVQLLVAELYTRKGKPLGVLSRMHDLLPGRYAFGLTGRGPAGKPLAPGRYVVRLRAHPPAGDVGAVATVVDVPFRLLRP